MPYLLRVLWSVRKRTHHGNVRFDETCVEDGVMVVDVNPDRNGLVVDGTQVWVGQLRERSRTRCLNLQYLQFQKGRAIQQNEPHKEICVCFRKCVFLHAKPRPV